MSNKTTYTEQEITEFMINVGYDTESEALEAMIRSDEYEREKAALMPELIRYFNGAVDTAEIVAEEVVRGLVYA